MSYRNILLVGLLLLALTPLAIRTTPSRGAAKQEKTKFKLTGNEATLIGVVTFEGEPPRRVQIDTSSDPACTKANPELKTEWVMVSEGKLANVVVYLRAESLHGYDFEPATPDVVLEHKGCQYVPHVLGMQLKQTLNILNSDDTTHNTHPVPKVNREWNQSQSPGVTIVKRFERPELFIPFRDNMHPWAKAYVGVFAHPYFSITKEDGWFSIPAVPPGSYTVVAWHENLGEQSTEVFLNGNEQKSVAFTFKRQ